MFRALCLLLSVPAAVIAQNFSVAGGFVVAVPQSEFATKVDNNGYGLEVYGAYAPAVNPFSAGMTLRFMTYGSEDRREPFSTTIPDVFVTVNTTNNLFMFELEGRLQPNTGLFRPYLSGQLGGNLLTTTTTIKNESTNEEIASSTNENDGAFNYGGGAGVDILLWTAPEEVTEEHDVRQVLLHVGASYVYGGQAKYLKEGSIRRVGGQVQYDLQQSKTDVLLYQIGVTVTF